MADTQRNQWCFLEFLSRIVLLRPFFLTSLVFGCPLWVPVLCVFNGLCMCVSRAVLLLLLPVCFLKTRDEEGMEFGGWEGSGRTEG